MRIVVIVSMVAAAAGLCTGCLEWVVPEQQTPPAPAVDGGSPSGTAPAASPADLATAASAVDAAGGGTAMATGFAAMQVGLDAKGCTAGGCHGGLQTPQLKAAPATDADKMANYTAFKTGCVQGKCVDTATPEQSLMLKKPLQDSGLTHVGGKLFADFNDPVYVQWLAWIKAGAPY